MKPLLPIALDIETSGIDLLKCGIWQIGAIDLNTMEEFFDECRIDDEDEIVNIPSAYKTFEEITGKTEEEIRDRNKQAQKELLEKFLKWVSEKPLKNFICQNPTWDVGWIEIRIKKYGLEKTFGYRTFDLHTLAQTKFQEMNDKFLINEKKGKSDMALSNVMKFCGFPKDPRGAHNALEDAKLTSECFSRLIYGKNLFPEYSKFEIPRELRKQ